MVLGARILPAAGLHRLRLAPRGALAAAAVVVVVAVAKITRDCPSLPEITRDWQARYSGRVKEYNHGQMMQCELHKEMPYTRLPHCIRTARQRAVSEWVASGGGVRVAAGGAKKRARPGRCGGGEPGASCEERGDDAEGEGEEGDEEMEEEEEAEEEEEEEAARVWAARELDEPAPTLGSILWRCGTRRGSWIRW